jgi:two-component system sensor histidine kinase KdpD
MNPKVRRKTPDELLSEIDEGDYETDGRLKIFLGYASGVGKSYRMFDEARRRRERGQDVIVGATQPIVPSEAAKLLPHIEVLPLKQYPSGSAIDLEGVLRRRPYVCVIDGLAYNNPPGLRNQTRWQDVLDLVGAGIKVIGSINIQYIEELREQVEPITGKHVTETVPVSFIESADEIEIVDAPTEEPLERSREEEVGANERRERLSLLRELALVLAADVVDHQLSSYLDKHGIRQHFGAQERILVCITPRSNARDMIETARFIADSFHAEMTVVYVKQRDLSEEDENELGDKLALARNMGSHTEILGGEDPVDTLLDYAQTHGITQLFIGHSQRQRSLIRQDPVDVLIRRSQGMDIRIFPQ